MKRYRPELWDFGPADVVGGNMNESEDGAWVKYVEAAAMVAELEAEVEFEKSMSDRRADERDKALCSLAIAGARACTQTEALAEATALVSELTQHLDYIGWGDSYEREQVCAKGGLEDRAEAFLAEHVEVPE